MDKTIRWNVDPEEQQAETYRYWQNRPIGERLSATSKLSVEVYRFKEQVNDGKGLSRHPVRAKRT
jgi:hypothetical protein